MKTHRILELYSGIGGMHCAWNESSLPGEIVTAVDINTVANEVYKYNFPDTHLINRNIQSLTGTEIKSYNVNTILMSPPCQPFTRNGKYLDDNDPRTNSFLYIIDILHELDNIEYILMENVKGFECSTVRNLFIEKLEETNFIYQEFLLCPSTIGIPNSRLRYYCIARRTKAPWNFNRKSEIIHILPKDFEKPYKLEDILETNVPEKFLVNDKLLRRGNVFDICHKGSSRSCCFTKAYSHYVEGTGSIYTDESQQKVDSCFKAANRHESGSEAFVQCLKELKLRFFTPKEVLSLMAFPKYYLFPDNITTKQCYRLLGNSVNVKVITELLKILYD
ncbi:tRNA (cytosine(38)-C(5))-methyltransferase [Amyelois transitella]|uniref:tRNA (cytosine(38)-C(5))-methyltransferase n=1 Tax=Amyelois transitella TaxID=680683 RepID=UPI00298F7088|nr:tRNA (cytosine(38)-C(5))-methyltransferase [Amyelois transitella]